MYAHQRERGMTQPKSKEKVAILAGGGVLPTAVAQAILKAEKQILMVTFKGQPQPEIMENVPTIELGLGAIAKVIKTLKTEKCTHVCMAGFLSKPSFFDLKLDMRGAKILASLATHNDDALLSRLCREFESEGFIVLGAHDLVPQLLASEGVLGKNKPTDKQLKDINIGFKVAKALGTLDIGQAVIVKDQVVLGVEAVEGTAELIKRCAPLRGRKNKGGVLIKAIKPNQDTRVDMPGVGLLTLQSLKDLGFDGLAVEAGQTLLLDGAAFIEEADKLGLYVYGVSEEKENV